MTRTKHPVVLIHGVFGYGRKRPFWNRWLGYWPERALDEMNANYLLVDIGALSSDHDRACEAFYQLYGGRVDYGEEHSRQHGHTRFGETFDNAHHPNWSEDNPVHLLGHSVGATTAIELYQLVCQDFFGVGSSHTWVKSLVSVAGPLSGTTLTHFFGLHDGTLAGLSLGHFIGASLCLWHRLQAQFPVLKNVFDYRMPQWEFVTSYREILSTRNRILLSPDLAVYDILPARRRERNRSLRHMDKPFLVSVVTSSSSKLPATELMMTFALALLVVVSGVSWLWYNEVEIAIACGFAAFGAWLWLRKRLFLPIMQWRMRCCVQNLHEIFTGFDRDEWQHNDGAVNICSMHYPDQLSTASSHQSKPDSDVSTASSHGSPRRLSTFPSHALELDSFGSLALKKQDKSSKQSQPTFKPGHWYVHKIASNHKASTNFDRESPKLFRQLLRLIADEFEKIDTAPF